MKIVLFANSDWYLYNFRASLALAAREAGNEVLLVSPPGAYAEKLKDLGFRWIAAPMRRRSLNPVQEFRLLAWLWRVLREEKADVIHGFTLKCAIYGSLAARLAGAARVGAVTGLGYVYTSNDLRARILRPLLQSLMWLSFGGRRAHLVVQNSDDLSFFRRVCVTSREQISLIPGSGVDCRKFAAQASLRPEPQSEFRVVLAARMLWDKGIGEYVEAARLVKASGRKVRFQLAGAEDPGNPASIPEECLSLWANSGIVERLGHVEDMPALFAGADVVVLPSYREGLPKSLIEAAACGCAIVTTDVPGCREVVSHGRDGLVVQPRDALGLAEAVASLYDDPDGARKLGRAARKKARAVYDQRHINARTLTVYQNLKSAEAPGRVAPPRHATPALLSE